MGPANLFVYTKNYQSQLDTQVFAHAFPGFSFLSDLCRHQQHVDSVQCRFDWNLSRFAAEAEDVDSWTKL